MKWKIALILALPVVAYFGVKTYLHMEVGKSVDSMIAQISSLATVRYESVTSSLDGRLGITGIVIRPRDTDDAITIREFSVKTPSMFYILDLENQMRDNNLPTKLSARILGVSVPTHSPLLRQLEKSMYGRAPEASLAALENCVTRTNTLLSQQYLLRYGSIDMDGQMGYQFDQAQGEFLMHFSVAQKDAYEIVGEVALPLENFSMFALQAAIADPTIAHASLRISDDGYFERLYAYCAQEDIIDRAEVAALLTDEYLGMFTEFSIEPNDAMVADYRKFVDGGSELIVSMHPRKPQQLKFIDLYAPEDVHALLNLRTEVN